MEQQWNILLDWMGGNIHFRKPSFKSCEVKLFVMGQMLEDDFLPLFHIRGIYAPWPWDSIVSWWPCGSHGDIMNIYVILCRLEYWFSMVITCYNMLLPTWNSSSPTELVNYYLGTSSQLQFSKLWNIVPELFASPVLPVGIGREFPAVPLLPPWENHRNIMGKCWEIQYLLGALEPWNFYDFPLGMSSSQLTKSIIFWRGRYTTNQIWMEIYGKIVEFSWGTFSSHVWWEFDDQIPTWMPAVELNQHWRSMFMWYCISTRSRNNCCNNNFVIGIHASFIDFSVFFQWKDVAPPELDDVFFFLVRPLYNYSHAGVDRIWWNMDISKINTK